MCGVNFEILATKCLFFEVKVPCVKALNCIRVYLATARNCFYILSLINPFSLRALPIAVSRAEMLTETSLRIFQVDVRNMSPYVQVLGRCRRPTQWSPLSKRKPPRRSSLDGWQAALNSDLVLKDLVTQHGKAGPLVVVP